jgi:hypothetical protein
MLPCCRISEQKKITDTNQSKQRTISFILLKKSVKNKKEERKTHSAKNNNRMKGTQEQLEKNKIRLEKKV